MSFTMSFKEMRNKSGPDIEPWGTQMIKLSQTDSPPGKTTLCLQILKQFLNHSESGPVRPTYFNFDNKPTDNSK